MTHKANTHIRKHIRSHIPPLSPQEQIRNIARQLVRCSRRHRGRLGLTEAETGIGRGSKVGRRQRQREAGADRQGQAVLK